MCILYIITQYASKVALLSSQVYSEYRASLAFDLVSSRQKNVSSRLVILAHAADECSFVECCNLRLYKGCNASLRLSAGLYRLQ